MVLSRKCESHEISVTVTGEGHSGIGGQDASAGFFAEVVAQAKFCLSGKQKRAGSRYRWNKDLLKFSQAGVQSVHTTSQTRVRLASIKKHGKQPIWPNSAMEDHMCGHTLASVRFLTQPASEIARSENIKQLSERGTTWAPSRRN